jgi:hypothetical protein
MKAAQFVAEESAPNAVHAFQHLKQQFSPSSNAVEQQSPLAVRKLLTAFVRPARTGQLMMMI